VNVDKFLLADDNTLLRASLAKLIGLWRPDAVIEEEREVVEVAGLRPHTQGSELLGRDLADIHRRQERAGHQLRSAP